jgi:hypothetical protein
VPWDPPQNGGASLSAAGEAVRVGVEMSAKVWVATATAGAEGLMKPAAPQAPAAVSTTEL